MDFTLSPHHLNSSDGCERILSTKENIKIFLGGINISKLKEFQHYNQIQEWLHLYLFWSGFFLSILFARKWQIWGPLKFIF